MTRRCCAHVFQWSASTSTETTPAALHELLVRHAGTAPAAAQTLLVIETCDAAGRVHDLAAAVGRLAGGWGEGAAELRASSCGR